MWKLRSRLRTGPPESSNHTVAVWKPAANHICRACQGRSNHTVAVWKPVAFLQLLENTKVQITPSRCGNCLLKSSSFARAGFKSHRRGVETQTASALPGLPRSNHTVAVWKLPRRRSTPLPIPRSNHTVAVWKPFLATYPVATWKFKSHRRGVETSRAL